jgi:AraC-like DNA-binding protein
MNPVYDRLPWCLYNIPDIQYRFDAMADLSIDRTLLTESLDPVLLVVASHEANGQSKEAHSHGRGQLFGSTRGLLTVGLDTGVWVVPATHAVWVPPRRLHWARSHGPFHGYAAYVAESSCAELPATPCSIRCSDLLRAAVLRAAGWDAGPLDARSQRTAAVILDEIRHQPVDPLGLPLPRDARLMRIAQALLDEPASERSLEDWAAWAAVGERTLSRRFVSETGFTFTAWRQRARLQRALQMLADGMPVNAIAIDLGYSTPSTFIALFRRAFGQTPAVYRQHIGIE